MRSNSVSPSWLVRGLSGLLVAVLGACASAPRLPSDHPARAGGPSAPLAEVGRSLHDDPVPLAPVENAGREPGAPDGNPHASHGAHGGGR